VVEVLGKEKREVNMAISTNPITVAQYLHSFEGYPDLNDELVNGRIVMKPRPEPLHQHISRNIERLLGTACEDTNYTANGNSNILFPTSNSAPAPDVFVVATASWEEAIKADRYLDVPPLLAVEVLSPSENVDEKVDIYLDAGVQAVWIVNPKNQTVLVCSSLGANMPNKVQYSRGETSLPNHSEIRLPFPLHGSVQIDLIFAGLP
jgi:Uma2 family endonuclease